MNYSSAIFLLMFLPLLVGGFLVLNRLVSLSKRQIKVIVLAMSFLFLSWGSLKSGGLMLFLWMINYLVGRMIGNFRGGRRGWLLAGVLINVVYLGLVRYSAWLNLGGSLGISFAVLYGISYLVEVYRGANEKNTSWLQVGHYGLFFPKLVAGPVIKFNDFISLKRIVGVETASLGLQRFILGLAKKLLLADVLAKGVAQIFSMSNQQLNPTYVLVGGLLFSMQIWLDFSGYTDMAIGIAMMLGYRLPENFNYPYLATSVRDFWRRWHMSFMNWLSDYVYIPLGGSRRGGLLRARNVMVVFLISGLWHGMGATFIVWGAYFGVVVLLEQITGFPEKYLGRWLGRVYTWYMILIGWLIFKARDLDQARAMVGMVTHLSQVSLSQVGALLNPKMVLVLIVGVALTTPGLVRGMGRFRARLGKPLTLIFWLGVYIFCLMHMAANTYEPFLYAQF